MSRLDSFIRRVSAQRDCLNAAADLIRDVPGPVLEFGLGNGRTYDHLRSLLPERTIFVFERQVAEQVEIKTKYAGYIDRQQEEIAKLRASEDTKLPEDLDYGSISGLSKEIQHKLGQARPQTLGQASRIPGVTPAAISLLLIHLKKRYQIHFQWILVKCPRGTSSPSET